MNCSCSVNTGYDDDSGRWLKRKARAAKPHKCYECGLSIHKGDQYVVHTVFFSGGIDNYKLCMTCDSLTEHFFSNGWIFGSVRDDLEDYLHYNWHSDIPSSCLSKLETKARDFVCDYLQEYQEE
jgi:hypothetical protein